MKRCSLSNQSDMEKAHDHGASTDIPRHCEYYNSVHLWTTHFAFAHTSPPHRFATEHRTSQRTTMNKNATPCQTHGTNTVKSREDEMKKCINFPYVSTTRVLPPRFKFPVASSQRPVTVWEVVILQAPHPLPPFGASSWFRQTKHSHHL